MKLGLLSFPFLFIIFQVVTPDTLVSTISVNCLVLRDKFAESTSQFTSCSIYNSRPVTLCGKCVENYFDVVDSYHNMSKALDNGTVCIDKFVNVDRLEIVHTMYKNSLDLWNRAKCYECYEAENGTMTKNLSKKTLQFKEFYSTYTECISKTDTKTICHHCMDDYIVLQNFYSSISNINEKIGVCMDIADLMNNTFTYWSKKCCKYRKHNEYVFLGSTLGVFLITILFYILTQLYVKKKSPTILQQTRFAESINHLSM